MTDIRADGIAVLFDPSLGLLERFEVTDDGQTIAPLHRAPWVGTDEVMPPDAAPLMRKLGGDFFCAPFATTLGDSPLHGWPPNTPWHVVRDGGGVMRAVLGHDILGAMLVKELSVADGHPFVYQRHLFIGGEGRITAANHANLSVPNGALIRTSPKSGWETSPNPQETDPAMGRSGLVYPARTTDPSRVEGVGGPVDVTRYPWLDRTEDFIVGVEAKGSTFGWAAVTRPMEGDLYLSVRDPRQLPMTMLWQSNGGRDYAPWSGRHVGCLGVEEGAAEHMLGVSSEADLAGPGAFTLAPHSTVAVRHVIGAIAWPSGEPVAGVEAGDGTLTVTGEGGATRRVPFDTTFLTGGPA